MNIFQRSAATIINSLGAGEITGPIDDSNRHLFEDVVEASEEADGRIYFKRADGSTVSWMSKATYMDHHMIVVKGTSSNMIQTRKQGPGNRKNRRAMAAQARKKQ